jgi:hypothetical protein
MTGTGMAQSVANFFTAQKQKVRHEPASIKNDSFSQTAKPHAPARK